MHDDLQQSNSECINVDLSAVQVVEHLRSHVLGVPDHLNVVKLVGRSSESDIADSNRSIVTVNEDVVRLQVSVDDGWLVGMQVMESLKDLFASLLDNLQLGRVKLP